ncbi:hypothetical protein CWB73_17155 [Pseudoalteromonas phenolica]|uniref:HTH merR-type domain-containing protein n=1 Tax=Pseudoalteromonas phenolica TaxID=161398 RepID=A0A5S3YPX5_9GAMM|nr:MerR family transcriptional regulator [Pseudoalteromonas phenolica]TMP78279.1 hypothetical protein CWB73_17155 [Pseudoalteromonas phenolica]
MRIKAICLKTGLSKDTVRFYEKLGLLTNVEKGLNGYKNYIDTHVEQLSLIKHAKGLGFTLEEIKQLAALLFSRQLTMSEMSSFLKLKEQEIDNKIKQLYEFKVHIRETLEGSCEYRAQLKKLSGK